MNESALWANQASQYRKPGFLPPGRYASSFVDVGEHLERVDQRRGRLLQSLLQRRQLRGERRHGVDERLDLLEREQRGALEQGVRVLQRGGSRRAVGTSASRSATERVGERGRVDERRARRLRACSAAGLTDGLKRDVLTRERADGRVAGLDDRARSARPWRSPPCQHAEVVDELRRAHGGGREQVADLAQLLGGRTERCAAGPGCLAAPGRALVERGDEAREPGPRVAVERAEQLVGVDRRQRLADGDRRRRAAARRPPDCPARC